MRGIILFMFQLWVVFHICAVDHQQFSQKTPILAIFTIIDGVLFGSISWKEQCNFLFLSGGVSWFLKKVSISLVEFAFDVTFVQSSSGLCCWNLLSDEHPVDSVRNLVVSKVNVASEKNYVCWLMQFLRRVNHKLFQLCVLQTSFSKQLTNFLFWSIPRSQPAILFNHGHSTWWAGATILLIQSGRSNHPVDFVRNVVFLRRWCY